MRPQPAQRSVALRLWQPQSASFEETFGQNSAFTYSDLLWGGPAPSADLPQALQYVRASLDHAINDAPHQSDAWLFLAVLASRYPSQGLNAIEALRMSYYTGPSEQDLMPLRLRLMANLDTFGDVDMRQLASWELRSLTARKQISAIAEAYKVASPAGKQFIEQTVGAIDPAMSESLAPQAKAIPN